MSSRNYPPSDIIKAQAIRKRISAIAGITTEEMDSDRSPRHTPARQVAMYVIRELTQLPMNHIGPLFNRHGDGTVKKACDVVALTISGEKINADVAALVQLATAHELSARNAINRTGKETRRSGAAHGAKGQPR